MSVKRDNKNFEFRSLPNSYKGVKDMDTKSGIVTGYLASFNTVDSYMDMIVPGAFKKTIAERGPSGTNQIKHLLQHDCDEPIGAFQVLKEDKFGLYFESKISAIDDAQDVLTLYAEGIYNEHSIGYRTMEEERVDDGNGNLLYFKLKDIKLWEGSTVLWGANANTPFTGFKSANQPDQLKELKERMAKLVKMTRTGNLKDETYEKLEIELLKIEAAIDSIITPGPTREVTPGPSDELKMLEFFNGIL